MLNTTSNDFRWNRIQEPARPSDKPADLLRLLAALDLGWMIACPVRLLPCEDTFGGEFYEIALHHFASHEIHELHLMRQPGVENFLRDEGIPVQEEKSLRH